MNPTLSSSTARRQTRFTTWSLGGLALLSVDYFVGVYLAQHNYVTYQFPTTMLYCIIPYWISCRLLYRATVLPFIERRSGLFITVAAPFALTPLGFAILQQPYSRGAIVAVFVTSALWFALHDWLLSKKDFPIFYYLDETVKNELESMMGQCEWEKNKRLFLPFSRMALDKEKEFEGVVLSRNNVVRDEEGLRMLSELRLKYFRFYAAENISEMLTGRKMLPKDSNDLWQLDSNPAYDMLKRFIDVFAVLLFAVIWLPLTGLLAVAVRLDSTGPSFFKQRRIGHQGVYFQMWKLRTMHYQVENEASFAQLDDPRITRIGGFLRRTRLDELPQLWNVLRGEMSLIGPRPEQESFAAAYSQSIPYYPYRHLLRPGLTGWAQVQQGYAGSADENQRKLTFDLYYLSHYSLAMDLLICFKTVKILLNGFGAR